MVLNIWKLLLVTDVKDFEKQIFNANLAETEALEKKLSTIYLILALFPLRPENHFSQRAPKYPEKIQIVELNSTFPLAEKSTNNINCECLNMY